jgi:hypothetical protein
MKQSELFRKSSVALRKYAAFIKRFGFLVESEEKQKKEDTRVKRLKAYVAEVEQLSTQLAEIYDGGEENNQEDEKESCKEDN